MGNQCNCQKQTQVEAHFANQDRTIYEITDDQPGRPKNYSKEFIAENPQYLMQQSPQVQYPGKIKNLIQEGEYTYKIIYEDSSIYQGQVQDMLPHGKGKFIFQNNEIYEGNLKEGLFEGYGRYVHENGTKYMGQFSKNEKQGQGKEIYKNGEFYEGIFNKGKKVQGYYRFKDGSWYKGEIQKNQRHRYGKIFLSNGNWYQGEWFENQREGKGKQNEGQVVYSGYFKNNEKHGHGFITENNYQRQVEFDKGKLVNQFSQINQLIYLHSNYHISQHLLPCEHPFQNQKDFP